MDRLAGFAANDEPAKHYTAPVWISEFGSAGRYETLTANRNWWHNFISWMIGRDVGFALWPLTGWQENGQGDLWATLAYDRNGNALKISDNDGQADWRYGDWARLMQVPSVSEETIANEPTYRMLFADNQNAIMSNLIAQNANTFPGDRKAVCPDGLRLIGLTAGNNPRGLCTDATFGRTLWSAASGSNWEFVNDERHVTQDWAAGLTKYTCARNQHLVGYSFSGRSARGAYCAQYSSDWANGNAIGATRAVYFDQRDNYPTDHGRFTAGGNTGACNDDEIATGYAFSASQNGGTPAALLCASVRARTAADGSAATSTSAASSLRMSTGALHGLVSSSGGLVLLLPALVVLMGAVLTDFAPIAVAALHHHQH